MPPTAAVAAAAAKRNEKGARVARKSRCIGIKKSLGVFVHGKGHAAAAV